MFSDLLLSQQHLIYLNKISIQAVAERKEFLRKKNTRNGYVNKKHNLVRK